jgi:cyanate lyase
MNADSMNSAGMSIKMPDVANFSKELLMAMEKEMLGIYLTGHPLADYEEKIARISTITSDKLALAGVNSDIQDGMTVTMAGMVNSKKTLLTKKNKMMAFIQLEDLFGTTEVIVFPNVYERAFNLLDNDAVIVVRGMISFKEDEEPKLLADRIFDINAFSAMPANGTVRLTIPAVVAINRFPTDTEEELKYIVKRCNELGVSAILSEVWGKGSSGGIELAEEIIRVIDENKNNTEFRFAYDNNLPIKDKIEAIAKKIYGADGADYTGNALKQIKEIEDLGYGNIPVCIAKTQYSLSDDAAKLGRPEGFRITVRNIKPAIGAGFIVALTGDIMTMPGLPKKPAAEQIDVDRTGKIHGLF